MNIKFGTDGWRGIIAEDFTFENVRKVSQAIADYVNSKQHTVSSPQLIVGYDRRFLSAEYAKIACEVFAANGIKTYFTVNPAPTPAITFAIKRKGLSAAVIITASHNPAIFNGIKFKTQDAAPADGYVTEKIEKLIGKHKPKTLVTNNALIKNVDVDEGYIKFIKSYIDFDIINKKKLTLLVDYMHGAGSGYLERLLKDTNCKLTAIRGERDVLFDGGNPEPVRRNLREFLKKSKISKPHLGIALDGDADRIAACGADGEYLNSGQIISLILLHLLEHKKLKGMVVKTISGTSLIEKITEDFGLKLLETPIGFKYISKIMLEQDVLIGGEESGGIGFKGYIPERDGIISGLLLLEMVAVRGKSIDKIMKDVNKRYGKFCYNRLDLKMPVKKGKTILAKLQKSPPETLSGKKIIQIKTYDGVKFILKDKSWLLIRPSGTEPVMRVYAEGSSSQSVNRLLNIGKNLVSKWN